MMGGVTAPATTLIITMTTRPDPDRYAALVLSVQAALQLAGLADSAAVWPDAQTADDERIAALADRWADGNPWA
jgi:hypothetical protein